MDIWSLSLRADSIAASSSACLIVSRFNTWTSSTIMSASGLFQIGSPGASKLIFIVLVLFQGARYLGKPIGIAIAMDLVWVLLFAAYLLSKRPAENLR